MSKEKQRANSLEVAYAKAADILRSADPGEICERTGATFDGDTYSVRFLRSTLKIVLPEVRFVTEELLIVQVLTLHYLTTTGEGPVRGEFISFSSIPNGMFYFTSFKRRCLDKLGARYGDRPEEFIRAAARLGGTREPSADYSAVIPVFPKLDLLVRIYEADDEFPAEATMLFSDSVVSFLPAEDTAFLAGYVVGLLERN